MPLKKTCNRDEATALGYRRFKIRLFKHRLCARIDNLLYSRFALRPAGAISPVVRIKISSVFSEVRSGVCADWRNIVVRKRKTLARVPLD
jgi:hypothetical protein